MFGILTSCSLSAVEKRAWTAHQCGLCLALKAGCGQPARMAVNTDGMLLSVLAEAQADAPYPRSRRRCPVLGFRRVCVAAPNHPAMQFAGSVSLLMGAAKITDHLQDDETWMRRFPAFFSALARRWERAARIMGDRAGFDTTPVALQARRQAELEKEAGGTFLTYSRPTELAAAAACSYTAVLSGRWENQAGLFDLGRMYGRILYLIDAYRDYAGDVAARRFNPFYGVPRYDIRNRAREIFEKAHETLRRAFGRLALASGGLASALLIDQLGAASRNLFAAGPDDFPLHEDIEKKKRWCENCDCCDCCECCGGCDAPCGGGGSDGCCSCDGCGCDGCDCCGGCDCG